MTKNKDIWACLVISLLIAIWMVQGAVFSSDVHVVGASSAEIWAFVWGHFWFKESIFNHGEWPFFTTLLDYPDGGHLWLKDPIMLVVCLPIQLLFGIPTAITFSQILLFTLSSLGVFLLCRQLQISALPSIIAGIGFAFCPHTLGEAFNGNIEALNTCWLPLWWWSWHKAMLSHKGKDILISGFFLFLLLISNQYWAIAMAMAGPILLLAQLYGNKSNRRRLAYTCFWSILIGVVLFLPIGWHIYTSLEHTNKLNDIALGAIPLDPPYTSDVKHFYAPMADLQHSNIMTPFQDLVYLGLGLTIMGLLAPLGRGTTKWKWIVSGLGLFFTLLMLGPALSFDGEVLRDSNNQIYALPWFYLVRQQQLLEWMTLPHRMAIPATLFLCVGMAFFLDRHKYLPILGCVAIIEMWTYPDYNLPLETTHLPEKEYVELLNRSSTKGAVLNVPVNLYSNDMRVFLWYQTEHGRAITDSLKYSEYPTIAQQSDFFKYSRNIEHAPLPDEETPDPLNLQNLRDAGFAYIVVHHRWVQEQHHMPLAEWVAYMNLYLIDGLVLQDGDIVYPLDITELSMLEALLPDQIKGRTSALYGYPSTR